MPIGKVFRPEWPACQLRQQRVNLRRLLRERATSAYPLTLTVKTTQCPRDALHLSAELDDGTLELSACDPGEDVGRAADGGQYEAAERDLCPMAASNAQEVSRAGSRCWGMPLLRYDASSRGSVES